VSHVFFFEKELSRELPEGHVLKGIAAKAIARRESRDDFLFYIDDIKFKYADVHLTWSVEKDPTWPISNLYINYEKWKQEIENDEC